MPSAGAREFARRAVFGGRVRGFRIQQGMSQEELAHLSELDRSYVGGIERGERNVGLDNIYRLADALGIGPAELFLPARDEPVGGVEGIRA